jgi:hypothetical protein
LNWEKLAQARTLLLVLSGFLAIAGGAALVYLPAGIILAGVLAVAFAYLTDSTGQTTGRTR